MGIVDVGGSIHIVCNIFQAMCRNIMGGASSHMFVIMLVCICHWPWSARSFPRPPTSWSLLFSEGCWVNCWRFSFGWVICEGVIVWCYHVSEFVRLLDGGDRRVSGGDDPFAVDQHGEDQVGRLLFSHHQVRRRPIILLESETHHFPVCSVLDSD